MNYVKLGSLIHLSKGKKAEVLSPIEKSGYLPYVDIKAFEQGIVDNYTNGERCLSCNEGELLIVCDGSRSGLIGRAIDGYVGSTLAKINFDSSVISEYLYYFIQGKYTILNTNTKGTGTPHLKQDLLKSFELVVPTLEEQKRIVARIEELFSELDAAVATLERTKEQLAVYRQAVLKEAFEGKYTQLCNIYSSSLSLDDLNEIKKTNVKFKDLGGDDKTYTYTVSPSTVMIRIGDIFDVEVGATPSRTHPEYWNGSINWVSSGEVCFNHIYNTEEKITSDGVEHSSTKVQPTGTVLLAMIGEGKTRGRAAILHVDAAHNQNTAAILVSKTPCNPKYLYYFLMLNYEYTRRIGSGNNQKALNKERVKALQFPFVSFVEQDKIVSEIESRLSVCDKIEETVNTALQEAEAMRQSILKQAFAGEL